MNGNPTGFEMDLNEWSSLHRSVYSTDDPIHHTHVQSSVVDRTLPPLANQRHTLKPSGTTDIICPSIFQLALFGRIEYRRDDLFRRTLPSTTLAVILTIGLIVPAISVPVSVPFRAAKQAG